MLSDVHCEERVLPETVNAENDYSLDVCQLRMAELEERFLDCLQHERNQADIDRVLVWLGGDFITGHIHPDCMEVAQLSPMNATRWIAERLRGMIDRIAEQAWARSSSAPTPATTGAAPKRTGSPPSSTTRGSR
jgi:hypothetical protein